MMSHPIVLVSATTRETEGIRRLRLNQSYLDALVAVGLTPLVTPPLDPARAPEVLALASGLVLSGGEDVAPRRFGAEPHPALGTVHEERDAWELALVAAARASRTPTLAICRGIQVLNVALDGTLVQDIPSERTTTLRHGGDGRRRERTHEVAVTPGSRLAAALGATTLEVNSLHHQALDRVGSGLAVTAHAPDGLAEGAEWTGGDWWAVGVQWHPEELVEGEHPWDRSLFAELARQVRAFARR
jgi:putative glutamine amidotransferase